MSDWTQDHYVTRNSTTDDPSGYRVWLTCRCGWDSGTLVDGNLPTTHRAELEHYVSVAPLAEVRRQAAEEALAEFAVEIERCDMPERGVHINMTQYREGLIDGVSRAMRAAARRAAEIRERTNDE